MNLIARIDNLSEKKLIGMQKMMSFNDNKTFELWQAFIPGKKKIANCINPDLYSIEIYNDVSFFKNFNPDDKFLKWAAVEVSDFTNVPEEMETIVIPAGMYAVFVYKGTAINAPATYQYIFTKWLPESGYELDNRPHFALMGNKYKHNDPYSEEEIWIPVKKSI
jgi:AraC family transcriptional regulator